MTGSMMLVKGQITALPGIAVGSHIPTYLQLNVGPNPSGIGQTVNLNAFFEDDIIDQEIPCVRDPQNYNVTVTTPSGTTTTLTLVADKTGGGHVDYVPTAVGTYKIQAFYGGQNLVRPTWIGLIQDPAQSAVVTLTVQQAPVTFKAYPDTPLPTSWWETPVSAENTQNWYSIMGDEVTGVSFNTTTVVNPYTQPILSAHVLWTKPWIAGGVVGGIAGGGEITGAYWTIRQYEQSFSPIIMNGKLWSQQYCQSSLSFNGIQCIDLFTGQTLYTISTTNALSFGMETQLQDPNMYGTIPYIIWTTGALALFATQPGGATFNAYDGLTGLYLFSIVNGSSLSSIHQDANGDMIGFYVNATAGSMSIWHQPPFNLLLANGTSIPFAPTLDHRVSVAVNAPVLCEFNFTQAIWDSLATQGGFQIAQNTAIDFRLGVMWAAPIPQAINGAPITPPLGATTGSVLSTNQSTILSGSADLICGFTGDQVLMDSFMYPSFYWQDGWQIMAAFNANTGAVSWIENLTWPTYQFLTPWTDSYAHNPYVASNNLFIFDQLHNYVWQAFSTETGQSVWSTTLKTNWGDGVPNPYDIVAISVSQNFCWNNINVVATFGGDIWGMNLATGAQMWYTNTTNLMGPSGIETPYNVWPIWTAQSPHLGAAGVVYLGVMHQYNPPLFHGAQLLAINMTTGQLIWKFLMFPQTGQAVADGVLVHLNGYDGQVWAFGKGPSAVTVSAPQLGVTTSTPVTITGTVMDVSPGTTQEQQKYDFPTGVPCVSDASESNFMAYVYENQPAPTNATGVPVTLTETDHNGNTYTMGTTRTDSSGTYAFTWTPPIEGNFTIVATFAGSNSYYGQCAETHITAGAPGSTPAPAASAPTGLASTATVEMIGVAIIIVIIIIGAVLAVLMMRKRP